MAKKDELIKKAVIAGLGTEEFLKGVSSENLEKMVSAIEERDGEISTLKKSPKVEEAPQNVTTVEDLLKKGKIKSAAAVTPVPEFVNEKGIKGEKKDDKKD